MKKILIVLLVCAVLGGCATLPRWVDYSKLTPNMTTEAVKQAMGEPYSTEAFVDKDNKTLIVWNYINNQYVEGEYKQLKYDLTPLVFKDNMLIGWGSSFYERMISPNMQKQDIRLRIKKE